MFVTGVELPWNEGTREAWHNDCFCELSATNGTCNMVDTTFKSRYLYKIRKGNHTFKQIERQNF